MVTTAELDMDLVTVAMEVEARMLMVVSDLDSTIQAIRAMGALRVVMA